MQAALATIVAVATLAGCNGPCTLTTAGHAIVLLDAELGAIEDALEAQGWNVMRRGALDARLQTPDGQFDVHGFMRGDDRFSVQMSAPMREMEKAEAQALLAPHVDQLLASLPGGSAEYSASVTHCGAV